MDDEKSLGAATGLKVGVVGCLIFIAIILLVYFTFWPMLKMIILFFS